MPNVATCNNLKQGSISKSKGDERRDKDHKAAIITGRKPFHCHTTRPAVMFTQDRLGLGAEPEQFEAVANCSAFNGALCCGSHTVISVARLL